MVIEATRFERETIVRGMLLRVSTTIPRFNDLIKPHENNVARRGEKKRTGQARGEGSGILDVAYGSAISRREFIRLVYTHVFSRIGGYVFFFHSPHQPTIPPLRLAYYFDLEFKYTCSGRKSQTRARERDGAEQRGGGGRRERALLFIPLQLVKEADLSWKY